MKVRIIKEVGLNNPIKYPVPGSFRTNTDVIDIVVKPDGTEECEYSDDRETLSEKEQDVPQVTCRCLCTDCIFNENKFCIAEKINLDYATTDDGRTICECKTYKVASKE
tara:strand:+ start:51 stop:377 length:327 start_codon:yes stop_codon:yes gene_type:complete